MTDRINSITITLDHDIRIDDARDGIIQALYQLKGVIDATPNVADTRDHVAYIRARTDIESRLYEALRDTTKR